MLVRLSICVALSLSIGCTKESDGVDGGNSPNGPDAKVLPETVSLEQDLLPMFEQECVVCHSGAGGGRKDGNLALNGSPEKVFSELTDPAEIPQELRIDKDKPELSIMVTRPSHETPTDGHPSPFDTDQHYNRLLLLKWIEQGANNN